MCRAVGQFPDEPGINGADRNRVIWSDATFSEQPVRFRPGEVGIKDEARR